MKQYLSKSQIKSYDENGYLIIKGFCTNEEPKKLYDAALHDDAIKKNALDLNDQS